MRNLGKQYRVENVPPCTGLEGKTKSVRGSEKAVPLGVNVCGLPKISWFVGT